MKIAKTLLVSFAVMVSAVGLFVAGYLWGLRGMDAGMSATAKASEAAGRKGMENMAGMSGMQGMSGTAPGMVMVSPEKQQLMGVRIATVESRPMVRTVRTVGTI